MSRQPSVAIVDYGMGNLFSVQRACEQVGLPSAISSDPAVVLAADGVILPGVGAFGDAMAMLQRLGLASALREFAASGKPLFGICLGMQLLMRESHEFGRHEGLGLIDGDVVRLDGATPSGRPCKVPQVGWNRVWMPAGRSWQGTPMASARDGEYFYFVHSFYVRPGDPSVIAAVTRYGATEFCSAVRRHNIFATQFHGERSGPQGLQLYRHLAQHVRQATPESVHV